MPVNLNYKLGILYEGSGFDFVGDAVGEAGLAEFVIHVVLVPFHAGLVEGVDP